MPKQGRKTKQAKPAITSAVKTNARLTVKGDVASEGPQVGSARLRQSLPAALAFLVGMLLVWAFLVPVDATSVFMAEALPQNLFWLMAGVLAATAAALTEGASGPRGYTSRLQLVAAILLLTLLLVSTYRGGEVCNPRRAWFGFWQVCSLVSAYSGARYLATFGVATRAALVTLLLAGFIASSVHGIYQVAVEFPEARARYLADPDGEIAKILGLYAPKGSPQRMRFEDRLLQSREPFANYALANSLGAVLSAGLLLLVGMALQGTGLSGIIGLSHGKARGSEEDDPSQGNAAVGRLGLVALAAAFLLVFSAWFLASSRVAYLAVLVGVAMMLALPFLSKALRGERSALPYRMLAGLFGSLGLAVAVGLWWLARTDRLVLEEAGKSLGYRLEYWKATWQMVADHPWFGVGFGNFQSHYPVYKLAQASEEIADPHNWLLDWSASYGLFATLLIVCWVLCFLWRGISATKYASDVGQETTAVADQAVARFLLVGAALGGFVCVAMLVLLVGLDPLVVTLTWFPAVILVAFLGPLVQQVVMSRWVFYAAAVSIGLCLLITGSWQASGIAMPLLVLMVLACETIHVEPVSGNSDSKQERPLSRFAGAVGIPLLAVIGLVVFVFQTWMPVTQAWAQQQSAAFAESAMQQEQFAKSARDADPLDADLQGGVAQLAVAKALETDRGQFARHAGDAMAELESWLELEKTSFAAWRDAGNQVFLLLGRASRNGADPAIYAEVAERNYATAVRQYPTSAELRIQLAAILAVQGQVDRCEDEIAAAIRLSEESPHEDKRLGRHRTQGDGDQMVWFPIVPPGGGDLGESCPVPNMVYAEPLIEWMRSPSGAVRTGPPSADAE